MSERNVYVVISTTAGSFHFQYYFDREKADRALRDIASARDLPGNFDSFVRTFSMDDKICGSALTSAVKSAVENIMK